MRERICRRPWDWRTARAATGALFLLVAVAGAASPPAPTIVVDAGHGGVDGGAYWGGIKEKDLALRLALGLERELRARGVKVVQTRRRDVYLSLGDRAATANRFRRPILVSLHFDASRDKRVRGLTVYYAGPAGKRLGLKLAAALGRPGGIRNRGCQFRNLAVLRKTRGAAVLIECGFISNAAERRLCNSPAFQSQLCQRLAHALCACIGK